jgi:hypothetical protein
MCVLHSRRRDIINVWGFCQGCQMVLFQTKNPNLGKFWRALEWKMLVFMIIWNILWPLVYFSHFGIFGPRKIWQPWFRQIKKIRCYWDWIQQRSLHLSIVWKPLRLKLLGKVGDGPPEAAISPCINHSGWGRTHYLRDMRYIQKILWYRIGRLLKKCQNVFIILHFLM